MVESSSSLVDMLDEGTSDDSFASDMPDPFLVLEKPYPSVPEIAATNLPLVAKKRRVNTQDIQKMQLEELTLEKRKSELVVENMQLVNQKLRLEIQDMLARSQPVSMCWQLSSSSFKGPLSSILGKGSLLFIAILCKTQHAVTMVQTLPGSRNAVHGIVL